MKTNFSLIVIVSVTLIFLCRCNSQSSYKFLNNDTDKFYDTNYNNFKSFLKRFKNDSVFQHSRIKFPLIKENLVGDLDEAKNETIQIDSSKWTYLTLHYDSSYATRKIDAYSEEILFSKDTAHLSYNGIDNGINVEFIFVNYDGIWYLIRWKDLSD